MKTVLHVLPHPGGGGETYVDALERMEGFRFDRVFLAPSARPTPRVLGAALRGQLATRRYDLLHAHGEVASALSIPAVALRPSVVTINGLHLSRRLSGWRRSLAEANLRLVVGTASATICVGEAELAEVQAVVRGRGRLVLVHNGVDVPDAVTPGERAAARERFGLLPGDVVGAYVAALDPHKEPLVAAHAAVEASRDGSPIGLLFAGDGPLRPELEKLAAESHAVRVLGFAHNIREVLAASDFFVLPSRREGLSFALLEAMAVGLTPVVSDGPGNVDAVGDVGLVARRNDVGAFSVAFRRLLDPDERVNMGTRARIRVESAFTADGMAERTERVYAEVLSLTR